MAEEHDKSDRSFKVQDRRRFTETGESREEESPRETAAAPEPQAAAADAGPAEASPPHDEAFDISFAAFVISLSTQALAHLGEMPNPVDGSTRVDLVASRQIIDIIAMLRDKTRGNLDDAATGPAHQRQGCEPAAEARPRTAVARACAPASSRRRPAASTVRHAGRGAGAR